ncbi:hypothetical protein K0040_03910 [Terrisporobacter petrolearius]|nr:hypothetical protein [Terrisporobacter petrolearius]MCC3863457.1 hypothetical protein [Terrisporobacter petrolearius]
MTKFCCDVSNNNSSLLICGREGVGKTHLGITAMLKLISDNITSDMWSEI